MLTDVVMAKLNITMARAVRPHVTLDGIDWHGVQAALTNPGRRLADGRPLTELFGAGWAPTLTSLAGPLGRWRHMEEVVGPHAMLRLLTVAGSTGHTRQWWGTGWWPTLCQTAIDEIVAAGLTLPAPYDQQGPQALVAALIDAPDALEDAVLKFCIDPPKAADGRHPGGLRMSRVTPPIRHIQPLQLDVDLDELPGLEPDD